jgi:EmrB/QacA subfamily drug resistance transporter
VPILLGPILGPVIGGAIVGGASWRWIFYVNVPVAVIGLALAARWLKEDAGRADAGRLDWRGFALVSPGLVGLVFGLSEIQDQGGIDHPIAFGPIVAGLALIAAFAVYSYRAARPLIDVRLFRSGGFSAASATTFIVGAALFGAMLLLPLYYQLARGASPLTAGLLMAPQGLGAAMIMPISGRLTDRIGAGPVVVFGTVVMALATVPFALVSSQPSDLVLGGALVLRGIGLGCAMMPAMAAAFAVLTSAEVPRATGALNALQRVGGALGTALLAVLLEHQLAAASSSTGGVAAAFAHTFWWAVGLSVLAIVPAVILAVIQRRDRRAERSPGGGEEARSAVSRRLGGTSARRAPAGAR